jgi:hypothetical protein
LRKTGDADRLVSALTDISKQASDNDYAHQQTEVLLPEIVMISPGIKIGIPGGYTMTNSAMIRPADSFNGMTSTVL